MLCCVHCLLVCAMQTKKDKNGEFAGQKRAKLHGRPQIVALGLFICVMAVMLVSRKKVITNTLYTVDKE